MEDEEHNNYLVDPKIAHQPFFSVIITTYNRAHLLERALKSLISQTETDWESIIIDDGSTDGTFQGILPFLRLNRRIKYRKIVHGGEVVAKNEGIKLSEGRFITFLDSDDEYAASHLNSRKKLLLQKPAVKLLHGGVKIIGNQFVPDRFNPEKQIHLEDCVIGGTFFIDWESMRDLKGFKPIKLGTDADLFERAEITGIRIMKTDLPTYIYHHETEDSITNTYLTDRKINA